MQLYDIFIFKFFFHKHLNFSQDFVVCPDVIRHFIPKKQAHATNIVIFLDIIDVNNR